MISPNVEILSTLMRLSCQKNQENRLILAFMNVAKHSGSFIVQRHSDHDFSSQENIWWHQAR